jgi:hypothetical protein
VVKEEVYFSAAFPAYLFRFYEEGGVTRCDNPDFQNKSKTVLKIKIAYVTTARGLADDRKPPKVLPKILVSIKQTARDHAY